MRVLAAAVFVSLALSGAACSKSESAQARGRDAAAKPVKIEPVRQEMVHRAVEVVGTLAAEDEVTVSSEADGKVSRILADLGDRVTAGQVLIELDREKQQYSLDQQHAALARALAKYGATETGQSAGDRADAGRAEGGRRARAGEAGVRARGGAAPSPAGAEADARRRRRDAAAKQASYDLALQNAKNLRADIDASEASDEARRSPAARHLHPRAVRRLRRRSGSSSLGELVKAQTPVMSVVRVDPLKVIAEIPEKMAPWIKVGQPVELHVDAYPDKTFIGKVSRISPAVNTATRAFPFEALVPNQRRRAQAGHLRARAHRERQGRPGADGAVSRAAVPLRRQPRVRRRGRPAGGARAEGRRAPRRPDRDRRAASRPASESPSPTSTSWPTALKVDRSED